jgi:hypothetical protein
LISADATRVARVGGSHEPESGWQVTAYLIIFVALNAASKAVFLRFNAAEYTDGILQLTVFTNRAGLYGPLYGALAWAVARTTGVDLEMAGRIVSAAAGTLTVIPIYLMARWLYNDSAARFAALLHTLSPLVMRWSLHVMTDTLFMLLATGSMTALVRAMGILRATQQARAHRFRLDRLTALASLMAALAVLTRYQGIVLLLPLAWCVMAAMWRTRAFPWATAVASLTWLALPLWMWWQGFAHIVQFTDRTTGEWVSTVLAYVNLIESFVLISPFYFTYPVAAFAAAGLFRLDYGRPAVGAFVRLWGVFAVALLLVQGAFGSFQYRYMMPLLPACLVLAGAGTAWAETACAAIGKRLRFSLIMVLSIAYMTLLGLAIIVFQRQAFGDQKNAALYVAATAPPGAKIVANEQYGPRTDLGCVKLSYWSGRPVEPLRPYLPPKPGFPPKEYLPDGTIVILSDAYGGGELLDSILAELVFFYHMRMYTDAFQSTVYPIFDDVMMHPIYNQNPLGWVLRYTPQLFSTHVYVLDSRRTQAEIDELIRRQIVPPGTRPVRGSDGRFAVWGEHLVSHPDALTTAPQDSPSTVTVDSPVAAQAAEAVTTPSADISTRFGQPGPAPGPPDRLHDADAAPDAPVP